MAGSSKKKSILKKKGLQDENKTPPLPPHPTRTIPGTEEKILVLEWRVGHGYQPHHPRDYMEEKNPT